MLVLGSPRSDAALSRAPIALPGPAAFPGPAFQPGEQRSSSPDPFATVRG